MAKTPFAAYVLRNYLATARQ